MKTTHEIMELVLDYADQRRYGRTGEADAKPVRSAIESLVADALRYQHIKSSIQIGSVQTMLPLYKVHHWHGYESTREYRELDAAIDAAMNNKTK